MRTQQQQIVSEVAGKDPAALRQVATIHRELAARQRDPTLARAHVRWAEAYEERARLLESIKPPEQAQPGDPCGLLPTQPGDDGEPCPGTLDCYSYALGRVPGCACHLSPPCGACTEAPLACATCLETVP